MGQEEPELESRRTKFLENPYKTTSNPLGRLKLKRQTIKSIDEDVEKLKPSALPVGMSNGMAKYSLVVHQNLKHRVTI